MATTTTRKPRLTPRQTAYTLANDLAVTVVIDENQSGLHGEVIAPAGSVLAENGERTMNLAFYGKREQGWPLLVKVLRKGLADAPVVEPAPAAEEVVEARTGVEFAAHATLDAVYTALTATMTGRQVATWNRTCRAYGPHGLTAEYRAEYHRGWGAAGKASFRLGAAEREAATAGFLDGFDDRRNGREPWESASAPTARQEQVMEFAEVTL